MIEVGIATAGFSGIVAVLGGRTQGGWSAGDAGRISLLLQGSFAAVIFSFLPLVLEGAGVTEATVWRISSASIAVYNLLSFLRSIRRTREASGMDPSVRFRLYLVSSLIFLIVSVPLQVYNVVSLHAGWPFVVAVLLELVEAFIMFARLLQTSWTRPAA
jgi:hypothetical protein